MQEAEFKNCLTTFTIRHNIPKTGRDKVFREIVDAVKANSDHVQITRYEEPQCVFKHMVIAYRYTFRSTRSNLDIMRYVLNIILFQTFYNGHFLLIQKIIIINMINLKNIEIRSGIFLIFLKTIMSLIG